MKRARSKTSVAVATKTQPPLGALEGDQLDWEAILRVAAEHAMKRALKTNSKKKFGMQFTVFPDPTLGEDAKPEVDGDRMFVHPTQYRLMAATHIAVLTHRTAQAAFYRLNVKSGSCDIDRVHLKHFVVHDDGSVDMALEFSEYTFDVHCYFGKNPCDKAKARDPKTWMWTGKDGYCDGQWCDKRHNQFSSVPDQSVLVHCTTHNPLLDKPAQCPSQHWRAY